MKTNKIIMRQLVEELRYWQGRATIEARLLAGSRRRCFEIGAKMRELQPKKNKELRPLNWRPANYEIKAVEQDDLFGVLS